jgi:hypothetical protein
VKQLNLRATRVSAGFQEPFPLTAAVVRAMKEVEPLSSNSSCSDFSDLDLNQEKKDMIQSRL